MQLTKNAAYSIYSHVCLKKARNNGLFLFNVVFVSYLENTDPPALETTFGLTHKTGICASLVMIDCS